MIQVQNLTKKFGEFTAVNDLSFEVKEGETFALLGPNGSGKSTTLRCLVGLNTPTSGEIKINGLDLFKDSRKAKKLFSYLPQRLSFPETLTAREVMKFYCELRKLSPQRIDELIHHPQFDFNGFSHKPVGELSGGMSQRLGLAVACLPDAPILLLDEPTVSLDPEGALSFREFLASLKTEGKTIVFTSHVLADVERLADRVAILVGGKLVALESVEALREALMRSCRMRVILREANEHLIEAANEAGALEVRLQGNALVITSHAEDRMKILSAIETAGGAIARFATEELSLENIYLNYISGKSNHEHHS